MAGPLTIRFATDVEPARRGIASLRADVVSNLNTMNAAFTQGGAAGDAYAATLGRFSGTIDTVLTGLAVLDAAKGIIGRVGEALNDAQGRLERTIAIAQGSRDLGVGGSFFQILTLQAKELGVETTTLTGILAKARDAATVKLGVGNDARNESAIGKILREDVQVGNISQADADGVAGQTTQEGRIKAILDLMDKLREDGKVLAAEDIGRSFFGDDFITKMRNGVDLAGALRKSLEDAKVVGGVSIIDDAALARAADMKAKVEEINDKYARGLKPVLDDIAYLQDRASAASLDWSNRVADVVVRFGEAYKYIRDIVIELSKADPIGQIGTMLGATKVREFLGIPAPAESAATTEDGAAPLTVRVRSRKPKADTSVPRPGPARKGAESEDPDAVEQLIRAIGKARDVQEAELAAVGKTVVEREKLLALARGEAAARDDFEKGRRSSATLDDDEKRRILERAEALGKAKAATLDLEQAQRNGAETARYFGQTLSDGLTDAILEGKSLTDVVNDIAKSLAKAVIQAELLGTGPLAGFLGTAPLASAGPNATGGLLGMLMGGAGSNAANAPIAGAQGPTLASPGLFAQFASLLGFADGGYTGDGGTHEPAGVVHRGEYVVPKVAVARIGVPLLNALARGMPGYATGGLVGMAAVGAMPPAAGGDLRFNFIDQRPAGSPDIAPTARRNSDGGLDLVIRGVESRMGQRASQGRGPFRQAAGGPAFNQG